MRQLIGSTPKAVQCWLLSCMVGDIRGSGHEVGTEEALYSIHASIYSCEQ